MAPATRSMASHTVAVAVVVAVLCLGAAKPSAACNAQKSNCLKPIVPPPPPPPPPPPSPPSSTSTTTEEGKCPINVVKLGVCATVLNGLIHGVVGDDAPCCPLIAGLVDVDAAVCVCLAIKANVLGVKLDVPVDLSLLVNYCGRKVPDGFQCPV